MLPEPDLLLFSEVWLPWHWWTLRQTLHPGFVAVAPSGRHRWRPRGGLVAFSRRCSSWTVQEQSFQPFRASGPWWRLWEGDGLAKKGIQTLILSWATHTVTILHSHLQAQYRNRTYDHVRAAQWRQLTRCAIARSSLATAVCAAGDFNTLPAEEIFLAHRNDWIDLTAPLRDSGIANSTTLDSVNEWIDYVLLLRSKARAVRETTVELVDSTAAGETVSDHHGLLAQLRFL